MWRRPTAANLSRILTQSQIDPPVTANRTERRSETRKRRVSPAFLLAPVVLVAVGVVLILVLTGGGDGVLGGIVGGDEPSDETPPFDFRLGKTSLVATVPEADEESLQAEAETATSEVAAIVDDLYTNAFLDPTNWRESDYEEVFALFADEAVGSAQEGVETLTLGATAGDVYDTVTPRKGGLKFHVLFDPEGVVDTVVVEVQFSARGARSDGTFAAIISVGQLFLQDFDGWRITAFDIRRADREAEPPAASATASASVSSST